MDKLSAMNTFVLIVEAGSLTGAADTLGTSLPTVVRTLAALERHLGVSLLKRTTRRIHLTDEGIQYLARCRDILSAVKEAEDILDAGHVEPAGKLAVTASTLFGRRYIAPIVQNFIRRHPKVSVDMLFVDRIVNLIEEGVDVAARIAHLKDSSPNGDPGWPGAPRGVRERGLPPRSRCSASAKRYTSAQLRQALRPDATKRMAISGLVIGGSQSRLPAS